MKKSLLTVAFATFSLCGFAEVENVYTAQDRTNWTIHGCSQANLGNDSTDKGLAEMIDGNEDTFWHAAYGSGNQDDDQSNLGENNPHFFVIDRGENSSSTEFGGFGYLSRANSPTANGFVTAYRVFVTDDITGLTFCNETGTHQYGTTSHADLVTFIADKTPAAQGTFPGPQKHGEYQALQQVAFGETQSGRYVIFVIDATQNNNLSGSAHCCEFYLYDVTQQEKDLTSLKTETIGKLELYNAFAPQSAIESATSAINAATTTEEITNALYSVVEYADEQLVSIRNGRRARTNASSGSYMTITSANKVNTSATVNNRSKWQLRRVSGTEYFRIMNLETKKYISDENVANCNANEAGAVSIKLVKNTNDTDPGIALAYGNGKGMNLNSGQGDLEDYNHNDGGSSWQIAIITTPASELTEGWYAIRNHRGICSSQEISLLGVRSADMDGLNPEVAGRAASYGSYWKIIPVEGGGWKIKNLITEDKELGADGKKAKMLDEGMTLYVRDINDWTNPAPIKSRNAVAISSGSIASSANDCIDMSYEGVLKVNDWKPISEANLGVTSYGTVYFFEAVSESDVEQARQDYITYAQSIRNVESYNNDLDESKSLYSHMPVLWGEGVEDELFESAKLADDANLGINDIATANKVLVKDYSGVIPDEINSKKNAIYAQANALLDNKYIALRAGNKNTVHMAAPTTGQAITNIETGEDTSVSDIRAVWQLVGNGIGTYKLRNHATGTYLIHQPARTTAITLGEEGVDLELVFHESLQNNVISFQMPNTDEDAHQLVFNDYANDNNGNVNRLTLWSKTSDNNAGAQWTVSLIDAAEMDTHFEMNLDSDGVIVMSPIEEGSSIALTEGLGDHHVISVAPTTARVSSSQIAKDNVRITNGAATFTLPSELEDGQYAVNIPMGYFNVNGKLTEPINYVLTLSDGEATAITNIEVEDCSNVEYFDLNGRRILSPVKGLYIKRCGKNVSKVIL